MARERKPTKGKSTKKGAVAQELRPDNLAISSQFHSDEYFAKIQQAWFNATGELLPEVAILNTNLRLSGFNKGILLKYWLDTINRNPDFSKKKKKTYRGDRIGLLITIISLHFEPQLRSLKEGRWEPTYQSIVSLQ